MTVLFLVPDSETSDHIERAPQDWVPSTFVAMNLCTYDGVLYVLFIPTRVVHFYLFSESKFVHVRISTGLPLAPVTRSLAPRSHTVNGILLASYGNCKPCNKFVRWDYGLDHTSTHPS